MKAATFFCGLLLVTESATPALAFPPGDNLSNNVIGQNNFTTGYGDINTDMFFGAPDPAASTFFVPYDVAFDQTRDKLYVADMHNHRVLRFASAPATLTNGMSAELVLGQPNFTTGGSTDAAPYGNTNTQNATNGCTTPVNACGMQRVYNVAVDEANNRIFVADSDNHRILVWNMATATSGAAASWVLGQPGFTTGLVNQPCGAGNPGRVSQCGLNRPTGLNWDATNNRLYVADQNNNRVLVYNLASGITNGMAATAVFGQSTFTKGSKNVPCGGSATGATNSCGFAAPLSVSSVPSRNLLYVSDSENHRIMVFNTSSLVNGAAAASVLGQPNFTTNTADTACGGGSSGSVNGCGLGILEAMVDVGGVNELFVSDVANHRVLVFDTATIGNGETAVSVIGQANLTTGYNGSAYAWGGGTTQKRHVFPDGVAFDPSEDRLFLADGGNHRVLVYGSNAGGNPIDFTATANNVSTTTLPDGSTQVYVEDQYDLGYTVTFPVGTTPPSSGNITINPYPEPQNGTNHSGITINATLPAGQTKTIKMKKTGNAVCIYDHANVADFLNYNDSSGQTCIFSGSAGWYDRIAIPTTANGCRTANVKGDLGDNPSNPNDSNGKHAVTVCVDSTKTWVTISGLRHSFVMMGDASAEELEFFEDAVIFDTDENGQVVDQTGGCFMASGSGAAQLGLGLLAAALGFSRRRRRSRK